MKQEIYLAGGCFWGVEKYFALMEGVLDTETGYANGRTENPTYEEVCEEQTGHAETVRVIYDDQQIILEKLLDMYYEVIDPVSVNRQGNDRGMQYRTGIYFVDAKDEAVIRSSLDELQKKYEKPIAVELRPLQNFYKAEAYHQQYLDKNPAGYCHIPQSAFEKAKAAGKSSYNRRSDEELKQVLSPLQYQVTRENGTEPAFKNAYHDHFEAGIYVDVTTGEPLFSSADKFESGCGWPAFSRPIDKSLVEERSDRSFS